MTDDEIRARAFQLKKGKDYFSGMLQEPARAEETTSGGTDEAVQAFDSMRKLAEEVRREEAEALVKPFLEDPLVLFFAPLGVRPVMDNDILYLAEAWHLPYTDVLSMPVSLRKWLIQKKQEIEEKREEEFKTRLRRRPYAPRVPRRR